MKYDLICVGLGNPGPRYSFTRHNIGFIFLDYLAQIYSFKFETSSALAKQIKSEVGEGQITFQNETKKVLFLKPQTFMNLSGESLRLLFHKEADLKDIPILCVHDEADISLGKIRIKKSGSDAGHNGLKSLRATLGNGDFVRLRLGVGKPTKESDGTLGDFVLRVFAKEERDTLTDELIHADLVLTRFLFSGLEAAVVEASKERR